MAFWSAPDKQRDHARRACRAALAIAATVVEDNRSRVAQGLAPIRIRIGLHCGEAIRDEDKFFGRTVIHAFRIADLAARDEILVSGHLQSLVADRGLRFGDGREVTLKGFSGTHPIVPVEWGAA